MEKREKGLVDFELQEKMAKKITERPLLVNEVLLDTAGKTQQQVLQAAIALVEQTECQMDYADQLPPKEWFYSWVHSNQL